MFLRLFTISLIILSTSLSAQINFSGFFDLQHSYTLSKTHEHNIKFGQFEIGLENKISEKLNIEGAIAFNSETGNFELGSAFADFNLVDDDLSNSLAPNNFGVMVGQFDVPFGIDYKCIASPDRDMVSRPLAIENSVGCLNSLGAEIHGTSNIYNFNIYIINDFLSKISYGTRLGVTPLNKFEIGYSFLSNIKSNLGRISKISGIDIEYNYWSLDLKGEYIWAQGFNKEENIQAEINNISQGYYLQILHIFDGPHDMPIETGLRYGNWYDNYSFSLGQQNRIDRISAIVSLEIMKNAIVKVEYGTSTIFASSTNKLIYTQLVLTF